MRTRPLVTMRRALLLVPIFVLGVPAVLAAEVPPDSGPDYEYAGKRGGLRVGTWDITSDAMPGSDTSDSLMLEGFYEKDLDIRLSIESTASIWRRETEAFQSGGITGDSTYESETWVLPMFTSIKFFPGRHDRPVAPFVSAGIGAAIARQDVQTTGLAFVDQDEGTSFHYGFGYNGSLGLDWNISDPLGFTFLARYQNVSFQEELSGDDVMKGWAYSAGFLYRFQQKRKTP